MARSLRTGKAIETASPAVEEFRRSKREGSKWRLSAK